MARRKGPDKSSSLLQNGIRWVMDIIVVIALAVFLVQMLGSRVTIEGHSMEPSLMAGDEVLIDRLFYHFTSIHRYDVVYFQCGEDNSEKTYLKRVVGLPGEKVQIRDGKIYINDAPLATGESISYYTVAGLAEDPILLRDNEYFLIGDNGDSSEDSRFAPVGNVTREQIIGKAWFRAAPFKDMGRIPGVEE